MTTVTVQCAFCQHFHKDRKYGEFCTAFPDGIPKRILENRHDHRKQYHGDHGIRFEPVDGDAAEMVDAMFADDEP